MEKWILKLFDESDNRIEQYGYSADSKQLKRQLKDDIDSEENEKLKKLINKIVSVDHPVIQKLKTILLYLKERTLNADMEELKRTLLN